MEALREYWLIIGAGVSFVVWVVRVEAKAITNSAEIKRLWEQRQEDLAASKNARDETHALLKELRDDIKQLLRGNSR